MSAVDYSESNRELRVVYSTFRDRSCIAHDWRIQPNAAVQTGDELGVFEFDDGSSEPILAPTTGRILRLFRPSLGTLSGRPAQVLALFEEVATERAVPIETRTAKTGTTTREAVGSKPAAPRKASGRKPARKPTRKPARKPTRKPTRKKSG